MTWQEWMTLFALLVLAHKCLVRLNKLGVF